MNSKQTRGVTIVAIISILLVFLKGGDCLSANARISLTKALGGIDLERRLERMRNLRVVASGQNVTSGARSVNIIETESGEVVPGGGSILQKNRIEGVDEYLYEGDINLTEEQLTELETSLSNRSTRQKRQASRTATLWTNKKVFYYFDASMSAAMKALVKQALNYITVRTCLTFTESATAANRIRVFSGSGCYSFVGMVGGEQDLSLGAGCNTMGIVAHEFMHALGINHMQSRFDRDNFVTVDLTNVPPENQHNYNKLTEAGSINYTPYEYGSVMHYDAKSFATTGTSMNPTNAKYLRTMGSQMISFYDISMINFHYKCNGVCATKGAACVNGGKRNPKNCNACICPAGYGGALCSLRPAGCGAVLTAGPTWKSKTVVLGNAADTEIRQSHAICNDWVKAPAGKKIQVQVKTLNGVNCILGCWAQGIEMKTLANKLYTNPRACCAEDLSKVLVSTLNPTPIIIYNIFSESTITYLYRYV